MKKKFSKVPVDADTRILFKQEIKLGEFEARYEKWNWSGIQAESIIFANDDIAGLTDQEIEALVRKSPIVREGSAMTLKRLESGFTFCNFNFK